MSKIIDFFNNKPKKAAQEPILTRLRRHIGPDGCLPEDFRLVEEPEDNQLRFAPGAMDGIILYHGGGGGGSQKQLALLQQILQKVANGMPVEQAAERLTAGLAGQDSMLFCIDELQEWILDNREALPAPRMAELAFNLLANSASVGGIKFALSIMELLAQAQGEWRQQVRDLALCDEFTLFCVFVARKWEDAPNELWGIAQRVKGWGRVHAVAALELGPDTKNGAAIREWLLDEGWRNQVLPAYSALDCTLKGGLLQRLQQPELTAAQFAAAGGLLEGLLDEGPVRGISSQDLAEPAELLAAYLAQARRQQLSCEDYELINNIKETAWQHKWQEVNQQAQALLTDPACAQILQQAMAQGEGYRLAQALGLPYQEQLLTMLAQDFAKTCYSVNLLLDKASCGDAYLGRVLAICREQLPAELAIGPRDWNFCRTDGRYNQLGHVVQFLRQWPGQGEDLVRLALFSPVINNRNMALNVLEDWQKQGWQLTEPLLAALNQLGEQEVDPKTKQRLAAYQNQ